LNFWECCARELNLDPMTTGLPEQAEIHYFKLSAHVVMKAWKRRFMGCHNCQKFRCIIGWRN
ncbi:hypothetical protein P0E58_13680, partial [Enterococcus faecalis]|uniref:hypothetical protein n=1 Tax=Enterococcus faecalis TaxID=1351 RepID=UPI0025B080C7